MHVTNPQKGGHVVPSHAARYPALPNVLAAYPRTRSDRRRKRLDVHPPIPGYQPRPLEACAGCCARPSPYQGVSPRRKCSGTHAHCRAPSPLGRIPPHVEFSAGAGAPEGPSGAKAMLRWVGRGVAAVDKLLVERGLDYVKDEEGRVAMTDNVLFRFLDFVEDCYGVALTRETGDVVIDVYGRGKEGVSEG
ncbi:hypothetical protein PSPO01_12306 [Paraphaeosphaeria sporulosa]